MENVLKIIKHWHSKHKSKWKISLSWSPVRIREFRPHWSKENNICIYYRPNKTISSQICQGKNLISKCENSGVYRIACSCCLWFIESTDQRLMYRLTQHSTSINNTLRKRKKQKILTLPFTRTILLFTQAGSISQDKNIVQHNRETVEIYNCQYLGLALSRDTGDLRIDDPYFSFLKKEANTLLIAEINLESFWKPLHSHNQTRY